MNFGSPSTSHLDGMFRLGMTPLSAEAARFSTRGKSFRTNDGREASSTREDLLNVSERKGTRMDSKTRASIPLPRFGSPESMNESKEDPMAVEASAQVPHGVDSVSYLCGERTALLRAFKQLIPQQQTLGALQASIEQLKGTVDFGSQGLRELEIRTEKLEFNSTSLQGSISYVEKVQVPRLQQAISELQGMSGIEGSLIKDLKEIIRERAMLETNKQTTPSKGYMSRMMGSTLGHIFHPLVRQISQGDDFLIAFARRILYGTESTLQSIERSPMKVRTQRLLSTLLLLCIVETAWRMQLVASKRIPKSVNRFFTPVSYGIKTTRLCLWSSAFVVGLVNVRHFCSTVAAKAVNLSRDEDIIEQS